MAPRKTKKRTPTIEKTTRTTRSKTTKKSADNSPAESADIENILQDTLIPDITNTSDDIKPTFDAVVTTEIVELNPIAITEDIVDLDLQTNDNKKVIADTSIAEAEIVNQLLDLKVDENVDPCPVLEPMVIECEEVIEIENIIIPEDFLQLSLEEVKGEVTILKSETTTDSIIEDTPTSTVECDFREEKKEAENDDVIKTEEIKESENESLIAEDNQESHNANKEEINDSKTAELSISKPKTKKAAAPKKAKAKTVKPKKVAVPKKQNKSKKKPQKTVVEKTNSDTSESSVTSLENLVRRSSRIKCISVLKQKGQGVVNVKNEKDIKKSGKNGNNESDSSENSNSGQTDSEKTYTDSPNFVSPSVSETDTKPVKVKSRWRRSSELEMSTYKNGQNSFEALKIPTLKDEKNDDEDMRSRLKQFVHLKENQYLTSRLSCKVAKKMVCDCNMTQEEAERGEMGCGEDCLNRLLMIECGQFCPVSEKCTNKRFQKSQFSPCEVFRTDKKGLGIRATANIPYGEFILEYVGEVIGPDEFGDRATEYSKGKNPHYYFMSLRADAVIDATQKGNISRFINHSCEPNAETQKWTVNGELRIGFFSTQTILAGEEITFDYQFQRYGKEAQKCYCEATNCRGWLGERPDGDDDEDEEDEEEDEEEEVEEIETTTEKIKQPDEIVESEIEPIPMEIPENLLSSTEKEQETTPVEVTSIEIKEAEVIASTDTPETVDPTKLVKKEKRKVIKRKVLKDIFDDVDVDEAIVMLLNTGLKNQAHTLKLSRLMVRANETSQRSILLRILRHGEFPCRRLFLDYHGLRLIHGWMNDVQQMALTDEKREPLRLELLQTLATLPIPNKTMLQDSKVLLTVEKWSVKLEKVVAEIDSESNSPKIENEVETSQAEKSVVLEKTKQKVEKKVLNNTEEDIEDEPIRESVGMIDSTFSVSKWILEGSGAKLAQEIIDIFEDTETFEEIKEKEVKQKEVKEVAKDYEVEIIALALKLLEEWAGLKEVFRIPKKERIEQMKEHEREADRGFKAGLEHDSDRKSSNRYRQLRRWRNDFDHSRYSVKMRSRFTGMNKHEHRKLFAMKFQHQELEKKQKDMWQQHEIQCRAVGTDPRLTAPFDPTRNYTCIWNQQTRQWQNLPLNSVNQTSSTKVSRFSPAIFPYGSGAPLTNMPPPMLPNVGLPVSSMPQQVQSNPNYAPQPIQSNANYVPQPVQNNPNYAPQPVQSNPNYAPQPVQSNPNYAQPVQSNPNYAQPVQNNPNYAPQAVQSNPNYGHSQPFIQPPLPCPDMSQPPPNISQSPSIPHQSPIMNINHPPPNIQLPLTSISHPGSNPMLIPPPTIHPNMTTNPHLPQTLLTSNAQPPIAYQEKLVEKEDFSQVKFAGPIPPPVKLPPRWKCAKDKYGRPYYYQIKIRISQWEPPEFPPEEIEEESSDSTSSSDTSSLSSDSSSEDSDDDDLSDTKLLINIRKRVAQIETDSCLILEEESKETPDISDLPPKVEEVEVDDTEKLKRSLDERLMEEFNLAKKEQSGKRKRSGLVTQVHIISPRSEEDKLYAREISKKYKENKERLKKQKEINNTEQIKKRVKVMVKTPKVSKKHKSSTKAKLKETMDLNSESAKKIKESFRSNMAGVMVNILNPYRKPECTEGKITNTDDFKHLARKLTHFVMLKELKHCQNIDDLTCTESVKLKAKEFVRKYMSKFGENYIRPKDDLEY